MKDCLTQTATVLRAGGRSAGKPKICRYCLRDTTKGVTLEFDDDDDDDDCADLPQVEDLDNHQFCGLVCLVGLPHYLLPSPRYKIQCCLRIRAVGFVVFRCTRHTR